MVKIPKLETILKAVGVIPAQPIPRELEQSTPFQLEIDKILYRLGALEYRPGTEYRREPVQWNVLKEGVYGAFRNILGYFRR